MAEEGEVRAEGDGFWRSVKEGRRKMDCGGGRAKKS